MISSSFTLGKKKEMYSHPRKEGTGKKDTLPTWGRTYFTVLVFGKGSSNNFLIILYLYNYYIYIHIFLTFLNCKL